MGETPANPSVNSEVPSEIENQEPKPRRLRFLPGFLRRRVFSAKEDESATVEEQSDIVSVSESVTPPDMPLVHETTLNPNIMVGLERTINQVPKLVQYGIVPNGLEFSKGLQLLNNTAEQAQITPESRVALEKQIKSGITEHLGTGLGRALESAKKNVGNGYIFDIGEGHKRISEFFALANEAGVSLDIASNQPLDDSGNTLPSISSMAEEQVHKYFDNEVNKQLPNALKAQIEKIGETVGRGFVNLLDYEKAKTEEILILMEQRGVTGDDERPSVSAEDSEYPAVIPAGKINRQEVQRLIDGEIKDNLLRGVESSIARVAEEIKRGFPRPLAGLDPVVVEAYRTEGDKYGVADTTLKTVVEGDRFNPNALQEEIARVVAENIQQGFVAIRNGFGDNIKLGNMRAADFGPRALEEYIDLAQMFGVDINKAEMRRQMTEQVTSERVKEGTQAIIGSLQKNLRRGSFSVADISKDNVKAARNLVHQYELERDEDIQQLLERLVAAYEEAGIKLPELAASTSSGGDKISSRW